MRGERERERERGGGGERGTERKTHTLTDTERGGIVMVILFLVTCLHIYSVQFPDFEFVLSVHVCHPVIQPDIMTLSKQM